MGISLVCMIPVIFFAPTLTRLFNSEPAVVEFGTLFLRMLSPFYLICCYNQIYAGALRGLGDAKAPMVIMLASFVVFRQLYLFLTSKFVDSIVVVAFGYPAGWMICSLLLVIYYRRKIKTIQL